VETWSILLSRSNFSVSPIEFSVGPSDPETGKNAANQTEQYIQ
jgi:hypothetical protein